MSTPLRILHLEDNVRDADLVHDLLVDGGLHAELVRVETAEEFSSALEGGGFDLILSDLTLPAYDGRSALALAHGGNPDVPFVYFSGTLGEEAAVEALRAGATDYVLKDRSSRLVPVVRRALNEARERAGRKRVEEELRVAQERFQGIYRCSKDAIAYATLDGHLQDVNQAMEALTGYSHEELLTKTYQDLTPREFHQQEAMIIENMLKTGEPAEYEKECIRKDGSHVEIAVSAFTVKGRNGLPVALAAIFKDMTERKRAEREILSLAFYDAVTGLPNRRLFFDHLELALSQAVRKRQGLAVLMLDLDGFKAVNDTLGHAKGDLLLQRVAERLKAGVRAGDTVTRIGGDEFAILLPELIHPSDGAYVSDKILDGFQRPFILDGEEYPITASVGMSIFPDDGADGATLLKNADAAMYRAKEHGGNTYFLCTAAMKEKAQTRHSLELHLRLALERREFRIVYQPVVDLRTARLIGMEGLLRWEHPKQGLVCPLEFIDVAEKTGLIVPLGLWVLQTACNQTKAWHAQGYTHLRVAVNLSVRQVWREDFPDQLQEIVRLSGLDPDHLELDITESMAIQNNQFIIPRLAAISRLGVRLSMDDFGTGCSSLSSLKAFSIQTLKIDQSFIMGIGGSTDDAAIVKALITLGHSLKLKVIAEGVETDAQLSFLRKHECDAMQGYLFSQPLPPKDFEEVLRTGKRLVLS